MLDLSSRAHAVPVGKATNKATTLVRNTPSPERSGLEPLFDRGLTSLKCRCDYLQVFGRRLAFPGSGQNSLDEPSSTWPLACVKRCGFISLNTLQGRSQGVLVLSGCVHCQSAETDNSHSNERCCEYTYGGFSFDGFHNSAFISTLDDCQSKSKPLLCRCLQLGSKLAVTGPN